MTQWSSRIKLFGAGLIFAGVAACGDNAPQIDQDAGPDAPVDLCSTDNGGCDPAVTCTDNDGIVTCGDCPAGYEGEGDTACLDIDECAGKDNGGCDQACTNTEGGFECGCSAGFELNEDGLTCDNIDECDGEDNGGCEQNCIDASGSFSCTCDQGYELNEDGFNCDDVNECVSDNGGCEQNCNNTPGTYNCSCDEGYTLDGEGFDCNNINECITDNGGCDHECNDTDGSFSCSCDEGYTLNIDGHTCDDINECLFDHGCEQNCNNTPGSYSCSCDEGYVVEEVYFCANVNECDNDNGGCDQTCTDTEGSFTCSCGQGYTLNIDGHTCDDLNECLTNNGGCGATPAYTCSNNIGAAPTCGCAVPHMCDPAWSLVYALDIGSGGFNWDIATDVPYAVNNASTTGLFSRVGYYLALNEEYVWVDVPEFTDEAEEIGVPTDIVWTIPLTDINILTNSSNLSNVVDGSGNMEFSDQCYTPGNDGLYDESDVFTAANCYGSMQIHEGGETVFAFNGWSSNSSTTDLGIGDNQSLANAPDWTGAANSGTFGKRRLEVWAKNKCLNGDIAGPNGGCMLQTVCGFQPPQAFAGGDCSDNTAQFAGWYCQLGGYASALSYTTLTSGSYISLYYQGGNNAVLSQCSQLARGGYGMASFCTSVQNLECLPLGAPI